MGPDVRGRGAAEHGQDAEARGQGHPAPCAAHPTLAPVGHSQPGQEPHGPEARGRGPHRHVAGAPQPGVGEIAEGAGQEHQEQAQARPSGPEEQCQEESPHHGVREHVLDVCVEGQGRHDPPALPRQDPHRVRTSPGEPDHGGIPWPGDRGEEHHQPHRHREGRIEGRRPGPHGSRQPPRHSRARGPLRRVLRLITREHLGRARGFTSRHGEGPTLRPVTANRPDPLRREHQRPLLGAAAGGGGAERGVLIQIGVGRHG